MNIKKATLVLVGAAALTLGVACGGNDEPIPETNENHDGGWREYRSECVQSPFADRGHRLIACAIQHQNRILEQLVQVLEEQGQ